MNENRVFAHFSFLLEALEPMMLSVHAARAVAKVRREIAGQQALIRQLEMKRADVMQAAAMDQVLAWQAASFVAPQSRCPTLACTVTQVHTACQRGVNINGLN